MSTPINGTNPGSYVSAVPTPDPGDDVKAADVKNAAQAIANQTKWLEDDKASRSVDNTFAGAQTFSGVTAFDDDMTVASGVTLTAQSGSVVVAATGTEAVFGGTFRTGGRTFARPAVYMSDADFTLDSDVGANRIIMLTAPTANRIITLRQTTTPVPDNGEWYEVTVLLGTSAFTVGLQREGSLDYVAVIGDGVGASGNNVATVRVEFQGGVWRLASVGGRFAFYGTDA